MTATSATSHIHDIPFVVQGYVTDPKLIGYQILTNYENIYWRAYVGNEAWSLYEVLRGFCHDGKPVCYPSIRLLMDVLGLKDRRRLTGRITSSNGTEYKYPGLVDQLQDKGLIVAEITGEEPSTQYVFHVNMTPSLLVEGQLRDLPSPLQERHSKLLEKCEAAIEELNAKKRPSKIVKDEGLAICQEGGGNLPGGGAAICQGGDGKLPPKQQPINNTHITTTSNNNNTRNLAETSSVVVALLESQGISTKVARELAEKHSKELVEEKLEYLEFLRAEGKVTAPAGWLRKAIEENYAAPDGFISKAKLEEQTKFELVQREKEREEAERAGKLAEEKREKELQEKASVIDKVRQEHGANREDIEFGEQLWKELETINFSGLLLAGLEFITLGKDKAVIGATNRYTFDTLQHPGTKKQIQKAINLLAKGSRDLEVVLIEVRTPA